MVNNDTCQFFIIFPEYEDVERTSPFIKECSLLCPNEVMKYVAFLNWMQQRRRAEHYLAYFDSRNIRNFLYPISVLEDCYPNVELTLLISLQSFAVNWRGETYQDDNIDYKLFYKRVIDDSFCEVCERKHRNSVVEGNSTFAIINHNSLQITDVAKMTRNGENVDIHVLKNTTEDFENWLRENRRPVRVYNWNKKHGENGRGAHKCHKGSPVAVLKCSKEHAAELLKLAIGEDANNGPLYAWDDEFNSYMEFKRESPNSYCFHSYHLENDDPKISKIKRILEQ